MFDRAGIDISGIQEAIAPTARVLASARRAGIKIVYLKMGYRPDLSDLGAPDAPSRHLEALDVGQTIKGPDGKDGRVLIRDTWGHRYRREIKPLSTDIVIYKHRFRGFYQTELDAVLKKESTKHLICNWMRNKRMSRVDNSGCVFQRLSMCIAIGLYERADRQECTDEQPRCVHLSDIKSFWLGLYHRAVFEAHGRYKDRCGRGSGSVEPFFMRRAQSPYRPLAMTAVGVRRAKAALSSG